jgi:hypothetical protein
MRFEVITALEMSILLFLVLTPRGLVCRYQGFGETYCLHLHGHFSSEDGDSMFLRKVGIYL